MEQHPKPQFKLAGIFLAMFWVGAFVALYGIYRRSEAWLTDLAGALTIIPLGGLVGTIGRRPVAGALIGLAVSLVVGAPLWWRLFDTTWNWVSACLRFLWMMVAPGA